MTAILWACANCVVSRRYILYASDLQRSRALIVSGTEFAACSNTPLLKKSPQPILYIQNVFILRIFTKFLIYLFAHLVLKDFYQVSYSVWYISIIKPYLFFRYNCISFLIISISRYCNFVQSHIVQKLTVSCFLIIILFFSPNFCLFFQIFYLSYN